MSSKNNNAEAPAKLTEVDAAHCIDVLVDVACSGRTATVEASAADGTLWKICARPADGARREAAAGPYRVLLEMQRLGRGGATRAHRLATTCGLTAAETEVLSLLANGLSVKHIARARGVSTSTVQTQLKSIFSKCGVHSQRQLLLKLSP